MRDNKGYRWEKHFNDYTVIDLETCGLLGEDRNSIIELSAIKVRNGIVVEEFSSLVNPMRPIPPMVTKITGIDNTLVVGAPILSDVLQGYLDFIGNDIVVGYNINNATSRSLRLLCFFLGRSFLPRYFLLYGYTCFFKYCLT